MTHRVGLTVRNGAVDGWVFDLPGCRAIGGSEDEVRALLPAVIADHLLWLKSHGEAVDVTALDFEIAETVQSDAEFVFEDDKAPATPGDKAAASRYVQYAHDDLMALVGPMPSALVGWKVPSTAVKMDDWFPDVRSIQDMADHVGTALAFHIRGLGTVAERVPTPDGPASLQTAFETVVARIQALNDEELSGRVYTLKGPRADSEWTARKSFRRIVNHQRFHTREVQQRLAWLTLGVPEFLPASRE